MDLPVRVKEIPHWRVNFRPKIYKPEAVTRINDLLQTVEKTAVSFRGWNYPHLSNRPSERAIGKNYVSSWVNFMGYIEYWRLYQSGQFIHLFAVREAADENWKNQYRHLEAPGFFSIKSFLFSITEIFEFAARLAEAGLYSGTLSITIEIKQIRGFMLVTDRDRVLSGNYKAHEDDLGKTWEIESTDLIYDSGELAIDAVIWFFERFGWANPPRAVLESDQSALKTGRF